MWVFRHTYAHLFQSRQFVCQDMLSCKCVCECVCGCGGVKVDKVQLSTLHYFHMD